MMGLDLTYGAIAKSRNESAVNVLVIALALDDVGIRRRALHGLISRPEPRCYSHIVKFWDQLTAAEIDTLRSKADAFGPAIGEALGGNSADVLQAIAAAKALNLLVHVQRLIDLAESSDEPQIRQSAGQAVAKLVEPIGQQAHRNREQPSIRMPILCRLAESLNAYQTHQNQYILDAFLLISTWSDSEFDSMLSPDSPLENLLVNRLAQGDSPGMIELLGGFILRRRIPQAIAEVIMTRDDDSLRTGLLDAIGSEPSKTSLQNLSDCGMPRCCQGGELRLAELTAERHAAFTHISVATDNDPVRVLGVLCAALELDSPGIAVVVSTGLGKCAVPDADIWMRAALIVADGNAEAIEASPNARVLNKLIQLLEHTDDSIVRGVRRVLDPLFAENMIPRFKQLRSRSRQRLGRVILMIDADAINCVRDQLRHPVLSSRMDAILVAESLSIVDTLADSFAKIMTDDHQEARLRATEAMGLASGNPTKRILQDMLSKPPSAITDAVKIALQERETVDATA